MTRERIHAIISVAIELTPGQDFRELEEHIRETLFAEPDMPEVRGVSAQFITWDTPKPEDWWSRVVKKGGRP